MAIPLSYNLRNLLARRFSTLSAALGIGLVVTVFILVLAMAHGFSWAVRTTGSPENAIALRKGAPNELTSQIEKDQADSIAVRPEIARDEKGVPILVKEVMVLVVMPRKADGGPAQVVIRGTSESALRVRPTVRIGEGSRMFRPGLPEVLVGRALSARVKDLDLGGTVRFKERDWRVVGIFDTGGSGFESEIWGDADLIQSVFNREGIYQSLSFRLAGPVDLEALNTSIKDDPKYKAELRRESQYYADQTVMLSTFIGILGTLITIIMGVGAVFGAMNTMYAAVGSRAREIATLRALGFGRRSVLASFLGESLVISALGGLLGCLFSLPLNGLTTSTVNWDTFSELAFAFRVTPEILAAGFTFAVVMGTVGGLLPALRAARLPITTGLRQV